MAQATAGKVKAPTVQASDSATQQTATNAVAGRGNTATQTATVQEAPGFWARFAQPLGYVACIAGIIGAGYLLYLIWAFIPRRRNDNA